MFCLNDLENSPNKLAKTILLRGILYMKQQNVSDASGIVRMTMPSRKLKKTQKTKIQKPKPTTSKEDIKGQIPIP